MVNLVTLYFKVDVQVHDELADDLGEDLAKWLFEMCEGDEVLDWIYTGHDVKY